MATVVFSFIHNPSLQERVRQEMQEVIGDSDVVTADHLRELKFLENVINESLRFYGVVSQLNRICSKDYRVPGTDFTITKGMPVNIEFSGLQEECFQNAAECDPSNFDAENNPNKFGFVSFGQGPRNCIGMRYAYIALKMAVVKTLTKYNLVKCEETVEKLDFDVAKNYFSGGVKFRVEALKD